MTTTSKAKSALDSSVEFKNYLNSLKGSFIDRDIEIDCLGTALIAEKSLVMVGPPGTGKSNLVNAFSTGLSKSFFVYLLTRYTTPDELFGHFSLKELKDNDKYIRMIKGKLPDSDVVFLDEVFKASSALLNSLLTVMNEREIDMGDGTRMSIPMQLICGASNEYPFGDESLEALWDRWIFRLHVDDVNLMRSNNFDRMVLDPNLGQFTSTLDYKHVLKLRENSKKVDLNPVSEILAEINAHLHMNKIRVSGRRWRHCASVIRARSAMAGRTEAAPSDVRILSEILWHKPEQRSLISGKITELCAGRLMEALKIHDASISVMDAVKKSFTDYANKACTKEDVSSVLISSNDQLKTLVEIDVSQFDNDTDPEVTSAVDIVREINGKVIKFLTDWVMNSAIPTKEELGQ